MFNTNIIKRFQDIETPFYYYDLGFLRKTLEACKTASDRYGFHVHYAMKANFNPKVLETIQAYDFGADCVSGNEVKAAIEYGFDKGKVVFAGVGKSDKEINAALDADIFCFNVESVQELVIINDLAKAKNKIAKVAIRINPNVDAHTHHFITTGLDENKFGESRKLFQPRPLQRGIVIIIDVVEANHVMAVCKQSSGDVVAYKTGRAGNENLVIA